MAHDPLRPLTTDALGPNKMPAVTLLMARAPLWTNTEGPLTASQVISSPGSPLTRDNLVNPEGEDTQRTRFPLNLPNGFFFLLLLLEQVSFILYLTAGDIFISFFMYLSVRTVSHVLTRSECTRE